MSTSRRLTVAALVLAASVPARALAQAPPPPPPAAAAQAQQPPVASGTAAAGAAVKTRPTDLDAFMARVLENRNENWKTLHDYILSEREVFEASGPIDIPLYGMRRDFEWFLRDGYLVRSPVRANGVSIPADERRRYEEKWLEQEKKREEKARKQETEKAAGQPVDETREVKLAISATGDVQFSGLSGPGVEPRFISEAYFMRFRFEPGNYYYAGREELDGREVLKIEYLPSKLFNEEDERKSKKAGEPAATAEGGGTGEKPAPRDAQKDKQGARKGAGKDAPQDDDDDDRRIEAAMNKTSAVTMWVDPEEYQIVRFRFENVDWGFLPGRHIVRIDNTSAEMTMGRVFDGVWLPREITFGGAATLATGTLRFTYAREFHDYRRGEVRARFRFDVPKEPQS